MKLEITQEKENKLLDRTEVEGVLKFEGATPSNDTLAEALAKKYNCAKDAVCVKHIYGKFGKTLANFEANVYKSKEALEKVEAQPKKKEEAK
ncbi:hypothetical protein D6825_02700 [Candidatus Woesearchaeota archaeon]|nr:MAG: hypothetical protein D6825_02700 [Candidatus Woesearchaeota archaeon]